MSGRIRGQRHRCLTLQSTRAALKCLLSQLFVVKKDNFILCKILLPWVQLTVAAKSLQSCPTLCNPIDGSPPGSPIPGILQARTLEWVAISFSNAGKWKRKWSCVRLLATPWTAAHQAPPSMGFSRQEYWSGVPLPSPFKHWSTDKHIASSSGIKVLMCSIC